MLDPDPNQVPLRQKVTFPEVPVPQHWLQICVGFNADPDPALYLNVDPDPGSQTNADPDPGKTLPPQKVGF
jgi:hypothetical protein